MTGQRSMEISGRPAQGGPWCARSHAGTVHHREFLECSTRPSCNLCCFTGRNRGLIHKLEAFHHGVARRITGTKARFCRVTSVWSAPPIEEVLEQASLFPMREYLKRRQTKTIEYVATRPIYHEATTTARRLGSSTRRKFWWMTLQRDD